MSDKSIVILGSGMAALGAAHRFHGAGVQTRAYDKNDYPGGHTATFVHDTGYIFDDGPHISFSKDPSFQQLIADNVGGAYETLHAYVNNYYHGAWVKHPAQANLHNLPTELKTKCVLDFIEASKQEVVEKPANYLEWLISVFGETFATHFPAVYGKKYHTVEAEKMSTVWMGPAALSPLDGRGDPRCALRGNAGCALHLEFPLSHRRRLHLLSQAVHGEDRPEARAQGRRHRSRGQDRQLRQWRHRDL
jgi:protoporphyrinogen oxidase